jgi:hypothetical protein
LTLEKFFCMHNYFRGLIPTATLAALTLATTAVVPAIAQTPARPAATTSRIPRMPDGKPNLNGIWQTMTTADWDLSPHNAQQSLVLQAGALLAEPAGIGVVEGGEIPYLPAALAKKQENYKNRITADP